MKKPVLFSVVLAFVPAWAAAQWGDGYIGETTVNIGNMNIAVQSYRRTVPVVLVQNGSAAPARCSAMFPHMPLFSETKTATVDAGKRATLAYRMRHPTARVDIDVKCTPL